MYSDTTCISHNRQFERVMDWVRNLLDDIKASGDILAKGSRDWKQMDALKQNREDMQTILQMMENIFDSEGKEKDHSSESAEIGEDVSVMKLSRKNADDEEIAHVKDQLKANKEEVNRMPVVASVWTRGREGRSDAQLTKEVMEEYKSSGFTVDRQGYGIVDFGEKAVDKAVHYANNDAEYDDN